MSPSEFSRHCFRSMAHLVVESHCLWTESQRLAVPAWANALIRQAPGQEA